MSTAPAPLAHDLSRALPADASAFLAEQAAVANLERILARVAASASTRACSQDLVRYARSTPEPLALGAGGNPWITEVDDEASSATSCCTVQ